MTCKTQKESIKDEKETEMEKIACVAIAYIASLAGDDEELSANLLVKLVKAVINEETSNG
jgi:hypothetical protein